MVPIMGNLAVMSAETLPIFFMSSVVLESRHSMRGKIQVTFLPIHVQALSTELSIHFSKQKEGKIIAQISIGWLGCFLQFARQPIGVPPGAYVLTS